VAESDKEAHAVVPARRELLRGTPVSDGRLTVSVTFDPARGYVATAPELRAPVVALSLGGLRRKVEALMSPDDVMVRLVLDRGAWLERDQRRRGGQFQPGAWPK
jgi:hypothetical protein